MLHITNGDVVAGALREAGLPGSVAISADVLYEGPCPTEASPAEWRETRARFLADAGYAHYQQALEQLVECDAALHAARGEDEVVLWFEHDLFDQLQVVRLTAWFAGQGAPGRLSLICIGEFPGISRFLGLGQLSPQQLAGLFPGRTAVIDVQSALAVDVWRRLGGSTPTDLVALLRRDTTSLPYLDGAIRRLLQQLPSTHNGLSRTEHQALAAIAEGASSLGEAFRASQAQEERVFMGDLSFHAAVRALGEAAQPLVRLQPGGNDTPPADQQVALTPLGRQVLGGRADHARVNGLDRWVGGVHLRGRGPLWRWHEGTDDVIED
jgi:Domain of unknown function (DUF1835)